MVGRDCNPDSAQYCSIALQPALTAHSDQRLDRHSQPARRSSEIPAQRPEALAVYRDLHHDSWWLHLLSSGVMRSNRVRKHAQPKKPHRQAQRGGSRKRRRTRGRASRRRRSRRARAPAAAPPARCSCAPGAPRCRWSPAARAPAPPAGPAGFWRLGLGFMTRVILGLMTRRSALPLVSSSSRSSSSSWPCRALEAWLRVNDQGNLRAYDQAIRAAVGLQQLVLQLLQLALQGLYQRSGSVSVTRR